MRKIHILKVCLNFLKCNVE